MNVNPGKLNKKIDIVCISKEKNKNGFTVYQEKIYRENIWAGVSQKSANEIFKANSKYATVYKRFLIRYIPDITYDMHIKYKNILYDIEYINNYEDRNEYVEIIAKESDVNGKISG